MNASNEPHRIFQEKLHLLYWIDLYQQSIGSPQKAVQGASYLQLVVVNE